MKTADAHNAAITGRAELPSPLHAMAAEATAATALRKENAALKAALRGLLEIFDGDDEQVNDRRIAAARAATKAG